jgi:two-component SAPR family response regulator
LLAYLIARGGIPVLRDEVAEALWPDGEPTQVQHLPSNAAYYLRRAIKKCAANSRRSAIRDLWPALPPAK